LRAGICKLRYSGMSYGKIVTQVSRLGREISRYTIRTTCEREIKPVDNAYKEYFAAVGIIIVDYSSSS
jgi:hypothetical protein